MALPLASVIGAGALPMLLAVVLEAVEPELLPIPADDVLPTLLLPVLLPDEVLLPGSPSMIGAMRGRAGAIGVRSRIGAGAGAASRAAPMADVEGEVLPPAGGATRAGCAGARTTSAGAEGSGMRAVASGVR